MDRYLLYAGDDYNIELDKNVYLVFRDYAIQEVQLLSYEKEIVFYAVDKSLKRKNTKIKNGVISKSIPILLTGRIIETVTPIFSMFNPIYKHIVENYPIKENKEIAADIEEMSDEETQFFCDFFPHKICDVQGYILARKEDKDYLSLFGYEDDIDNRDF